MRFLRILAVVLCGALVMVAVWSKVITKSEDAREALQLTGFLAGFVGSGIAGLEYHFASKKEAQP